MRKLLQRLGCSFHQVSGFLFKADPDKQQQFLEDYEQDKQTARAGVFHARQKSAVSLDGPLWRGQA